MTQVHISDDLFEAVQKLAVSKSFSFNLIVEEAIVFYINQLNDAPIDVQDKLGVYLSNEGYAGAYNYAKSESERYQRIVLGEILQEEDRPNPDKEYIADLREKLKKHHVGSLLKTTGELQEAVNNCNNLIDEIGELKKSRKKFSVKEERENNYYAWDSAYHAAKTSHARYLGKILGMVMKNEKKPQPDRSLIRHLNKEETKHFYFKLPETTDDLNSMANKYWKLMRELDASGKADENLDNFIFQTLEIQHNEFGQEKITVQISEHACGIAKNIAAQKGVPIGHIFEGALTFFKFLLNVPDYPKAKPFDQIKDSDTHMSQFAYWGRFYENPTTGRYFVDVPEVGHLGKSYVEVEGVNMDDAFVIAQKALKSIMNSRAMEAMPDFAAMPIKELLKAPTTRGNGQPILIRIQYW